MIVLRNVWFLGVVLALSATARGQPGAPAGEPIRIVYAAPAGCPDQATFEVVLQEHLGATPLAAPGAIARTLTIRIEQLGSGFVARLELADLTGRATSREIEAPTCDQAMKTMALVAAIAARGQAEEAEAAALERLEAAPPEPASEPPSPVLVARPIAPPEAPIQPETADTETRRRAQPLAKELSAGAGVATGVGPGLAPGLLLEGRLGLGTQATHSLAVVGAVYDTFRRSFDAAEARFRIIKGRVELCPYEPRLLPSLRLSPCLGFELGSHYGRGYVDGVSVAAADAESTLWGAGVAALRVRFQTGHFGAAFGPELLVPVQRSEFRLSRPDVPVFSVPAVAFALSASAGAVW